MEGCKYLAKLEHPGTKQKLIMKFTFQYEKNMAPFGGPHYGNGGTLCYVSRPC